MTAICQLPQRFLSNKICFKDNYTVGGYRAQTPQSFFLVYEAWRSVNFFYWLLIQQLAKISVGANFVQIFLDFWSFAICWDFARLWHQLMLSNIGAKKLSNTIFAAWSFFLTKLFPARLRVGDWNFFKSHSVLIINFFWPKLHSQASKERICSSAVPVRWECFKGHSTESIEIQREKKA